MRLGVLLLVAALLVPLADAQREPQWADGSYNWFHHTPIRIHLDASNLTPETMGYLDSARAALRYWERGGNGRLSWTPEFVEVEANETPDIVLWFRGSGEGAMCGDDPSALGCARPFDRPVLVEILTTTPQGQLVAYQRIREVTQHEIGHAIGMPHSDIAGDIMAPHASLRAAGSYAPGDWQRMLAGTAVILAIIAVLVWYLWRTMRPIRDVHPLPEGPASPCRWSRRRHDFIPLEIDTGQRWEAWMVCRACHGGYPAGDELNG